MLQANITGQDTSQMDNIALNDWVIRPGNNKYARDKYYY